MPRPLIPHGNRPRVPAGYEASYTGQSLKSGTYDQTILCSSFPCADTLLLAPHHSRPLPAQGRLGGAPTAESSALRPSPLQLTANQPNAPQKNMDQSEELARLRAELATLKMSISQQLPASTQTLGKPFVHHPAIMLTPNAQSPLSFPRTRLPISQAMRLLPRAAFVDPCTLQPPLLRQSNAL